MSKRGRTSTVSDDVHVPTPTLHPPRSETGMFTSALMLTSTIYRLLAMRMKDSLEAHDLWRVIDGSEINREERSPCIVNDPQFYLRVARKPNRH